MAATDLIDRILAFSAPAIGNTAWIWYGVDRFACPDEPSGMPDTTTPRPASQNDGAAVLARCLRHDGRWRVLDADTAMARIAAERLVGHIERTGFVVTRSGARLSARLTVGVAVRVHSAVNPIDFIPANRAGQKSSADPEDVSPFVDRSTGLFDGILRRRVPR